MNVLQHTPAGEISTMGARFRHLNEEIISQSGTTAAASILDFVCECEDGGCFGVLPLSISEWHGAIEAGCVTLPGHGADDAVALNIAA